MSTGERQDEKGRILFRVPGESGKAIFKENLDLIHPYLNIIFKCIYEQYALAGERKVKIADICANIVKQNPCHTTRPEIKYPYIIKSFLYAAYCGMSATELWDGKCRRERPEMESSVLVDGMAGIDEIKNFLFDTCWMEFGEY